MEFAALARWVPRIERALRTEYARDRRSSPAFAEWTGTLEEFTLRGGKRFRALLVLAGYHLATHRDPLPALPAAAALEHFQSWMLVHDDIIDHAETRRGGPTVHRSLEAVHRARHLLGAAEPYGTGMGITLGDLEEPSTVRGLLSVLVPAERRLRALAEYVRMTRDTAFGQLLDIHSAARPVGEVRESDVLTVHRLKTSVYTVAAPLRIGAILGGGSSALLGDLEAIGVDLGIAFQLRDDVLGAGFDSGALGKSANDLVEGKRTLLVVRAYATTDGAGRAALDAVLGKAGASVEQVARALEVIRSSGSLAHSEAEIARLAGRAERRMARSKALRAGDRALLGEIEDRLIHRSQ
jgi:geranylgeranyl diphosphate synthase type I